MPNAEWEKELEKYPLIKVNENDKPATIKKVINQLEKEIGGVKLYTLIEGMTQSVAVRAEKVITKTKSGRERKNPLHIYYVTNDLSKVDFVEDSGSHLEVPKIVYDRLNILTGEGKSDQSESKIDFDTIDTFRKKALGRRWTKDALIQEARQTFGEGAVEVDNFNLKQIRFIVDNITIPEKGYFTVI